MPRAPAPPAAEGLLRALFLSVLAAAVPITGVFLFPDALQDYEALMWLCLLVPAFLWAYERGWRGIATVLAAGMSVLSVTYAVAQLAGRGVPDLIYAIVVVFIATTLGIGFFGDRLGRAKFDAAREKLALQDPLTGLPNRRHAELHLEVEFAAAERGRALAVVLFDIDHLNEYNLRNGRSAGDGVLRGFGSLLRQMTRRMDLAARYGPEEFISVLGGCIDEGAVIFAGRVQERLRAAEHTVTLPTVSAGIACYRPEMSSATELLRAAEEALAQAKADGRDRVRIAGRDSAELRQPDSTTIQQAAVAETAAVRTDSVSAPRFQVTEADGSIGVGRSAFLLVANAATRSRLGAFLRDEGFNVTEGTSLPESIIPLQGDFDIVFVDVAPEAAAIADLIRGIRAQAPLTRVVGVPRTDGGGALLPEVLRIRVDAHYVSSADTTALRQQVRELLTERDALLGAQLRHQHLSNELRARDREAKQALDASEARYRSVVQSVREVIFRTIADGSFSFLNPAWTAITGFDVDGSIGRQIFDFVHEEDRAALRAQLEKLVAERTPYLRHEGRWRTRAGANRWIEMRLQLEFSAEGEFEGTTGVLADVTERHRAEEALRRSEEYYRTLIEHAADMLAVLNRDGTVRYVSPAVEHVLGHGPEVWIGTNGMAHVHPDDVAGAQAALETIADDPDATATIELRLHHQDGSWRHVEATCRNLT
ncbi:MAG TPA: PAS domain S-box protein, partial [Longimicrobiales bacterium]|nr:PAS domain S-box protein [Longimicrobiales bacterium]